MKNTNNTTLNPDNVKDLFSDFIKTLIKWGRSTSVLEVFAHNFAGFDGIFLLKHILPYGEIKPIYHKGRLISVNLIIKAVKTIEGAEGEIKTVPNVLNFKDGTSWKIKRNLTIKFKDSFLFLPISLRSLAHTFRVSIYKGYFPFKLFDIFYNGVLPSIEYWSGIPVTEYNIIESSFENRLWSFQEESIKYCRQDCRVLYEILTQFNTLVFNKWSINIHRSVSLPSLSMLLFNTNYMVKPIYGRGPDGEIDRSIVLNRDKLIYQLSSSVDSFIRESYTGGACDVYIPWYSKVLSNMPFLYYYDACSLYPSVMCKFDMPVGEPKLFDGDITKVRKDAYGFFRCEVEGCPGVPRGALLFRR